jgi:hypothetical protein
MKKAYLTDNAPQPTLYLTSKDAPVIKGWEVGKTYKLDVTVKQTSMSQDRNGLLSASFDVQKVEEDADDGNE